VNDCIAARGKLKNIAIEAKRNGLGGVEFLEGIPGSVGGALRMNAGAMGGATFNVIESVRFMDHTGKIQDAAAPACRWNIAAVRS